jgi:hypothetical protein
MSSGRPLAEVAAEMGPGVGRKVILWLPYAREEFIRSADDGTRLDCLLEYTYAGLSWLIDGKPPTLFSFLKKHGVPLPTRRAEQDALWRGGPVSPLAKYVRLHLGRDAAFWTAKPLSLATIQESLVGDLDERLLQLAKDKAGGRRDELHHLWAMTVSPKSLPRLLVLFERGVDELGHATGHEAIRHFEALLTDIERAIRRLRAWGYAEVHVVTDHGFVLLHGSANVQTLQVDKACFALLGARSGFLKPGEQVATATVPFPLDASWSVALPPGLRSFAAPGTFFHGGATLQEVVVPHVRLVSVKFRSRMRARALVPQVDIVTLAVKVELVPERPVSAELFDEGIRLRVFPGTPDGPRSSEKIVDIGVDQADSIPVTLFLHRERLIPRGTEIPVQVIDVDTGEAYATGLFVRAARDLG